jgi:hypothetical protein
MLLSTMTKSVSSIWPAGRDGEVRCKINNSGDYYYEVNVEDCAINPYDPCIVVQ